MVSKIRRYFDWYAVMVLAALVVLVLSGVIGFSYAGREAWKAGVFGTFFSLFGLFFLVIYTSNILEKRNLYFLRVRGSVHATVGWGLIVVVTVGSYLFSGGNPWSWSYWLACAPIILWFLLVGKK